MVHAIFICCEIYCVDYLQNIAIFCVRNLHGTPRLLVISARINAPRKQDTQFM